MYAIDPNFPNEKPHGWELAHESRDIDFCIWVLEQDGLQVPPFTQHTGGEGMLSSLGLDAESWRTWFRNIVIPRDPRLLWRREDIESEIEEKLARFVESDRKMLQSLENGNYGDIYSEEELAALKKHCQKWTADDATIRATLRACVANGIIWEHQQAEKAARELEKLPNAIENLDEFAPPPEFWLGNRAVREKLGELWQQYHSVKGRFKKLAEEQVGSHCPSEAQEDAKQEFSSHLECLGFLKAFIVSYPEVVEYVIPPITVIISTKPESAYDIASWESLARGAKALVESNNE